MRTSIVGRALAAAVYLAGCGGDEGGAETAAFDPNGTGSEGGAPVQPSPSEPPSAAPPSDGEASAEGMAPDLGLDPGAAPPAATAPEAPAAELPPGIQFGNGRVIDGGCTLVCADASTDPDAAGATDGWGYESGRSCLTPESQPAIESPLCDIPELAPVPALPPEIPAGAVTRPDGNLSKGFFVSGGRLFDLRGNDFVMRGVNHPVAWFQNDALAWMDEIATTDANSVRIVWETTRGATDIVRAAIERSIELGMVPMVEMHDVTGSTDVTGPARMAQYYVDEMRDILLEFEPYLLINIANEWGAFETQDSEWVQAYQQAIAVLRDAGINHTLVIDASNWGQKGSTIVAEGAGLLEADPQHNLLFSTHMYQDYENPQRILDVLRGAQAASLPLIVGEFGFQHGERNGQPIPVPYTVMVDEAARLGLGYLAWSWTGNGGGVEYLDLTENGSAGQLTGWGDDIVNGQNGIRATSQPASIFAAP